MQLVKICRLRCKWEFAGLSCIDDVVGGWQVFGGCDYFVDVMDFSPHYREYVVVSVTITPSGVAIEVRELMERGALIPYLFTIPSTMSIAR